MSDDRRHPTAMKNAAQKYDPIAPIERSHDGRRPHQRQQQRLAFALGSSIIVVLFILVLSLRPHEPAEVGNDHICSLLANVPANATWMGCSLSSCANELMAGARRMQSAVNSSLLMAAADTAATHVNLSHVCSAVEWTLRNVGVNGALVVVDDELEDSVLLGMRAVGGLYHLIGELMMRRRASGGCGRVSWTLRRLAQDGPDKGFAPLHAAVWRAVLNHMLSATSVAIGTGTSSKAKVRKEALVWWQTVQRICLPLADRDGASLLLNCMHGAGHAAMLLAAQRTNGYTHDACSPARSCSVMALGRRSVEAATSICHSAPSAGMAHLWYGPLSSDAPRPERGDTTLPGTRSLPPPPMTCSSSSSCD